MKLLDRLKVCWGIITSSNILYLGDSHSHIDPPLLELGLNSEDTGSMYYVEQTDRDTYAVMYKYKHYERHHIQYFKYKIVQGHYEECRDIVLALNKLITTRVQG